MRSLVAVCLLLTLSGCATAVRSSQEIFDTTKVSYDKYSAKNVISAPTIQLPEMIPNLTSTNLFATYSDSCEVPSVIMYLEHFDQFGWKFMDRASDSRGVELKIAVVDREVDSHANVHEKLSIGLSTEYIENHIKDGLDIRVLGTRGAIIAKVPALYVQGFYEKLVATRRAKCGDSGHKPPGPLSVLGVDFFPGAQIKGAGATIFRVKPNSTAAVAGLLAGDIIVKYDEKQVYDYPQLQALVAATPPGKSVQIEVIHLGKRSKVMAIMQAPGAVQLRIE